jgi:chloramphenicol O-acetyltransferase
VIAPQVKDEETESQKGPPKEELIKLSNLPVLDFTEPPTISKSDLLPEDPSADNTN